MPADEYTWFTNKHSWWDEGLMWWNRPVRLADIIERHGGCAVLRGSQPWTLPPRIEREVPGLTFADQCRAGEEDVFTIGVRCDGTRPQPR